MIADHVRVCCKVMNQGSRILLNAMPLHLMLPYVLHKESHRIGQELNEEFP